MRKLFLAVLLALPVLPAAQVGMDVSLMEKQDSMRRETETKIKKEILDPILGADKSFVFADVELSVISKKAEQTKDVLGIGHKYKEQGFGKNNPDTDFLLPGIPKPRSILGAENKRPEAAYGQQAQQAQNAQEIRYGIETEITRFQLTVIHDEALPKEPVKLARERVDDFLLPYKIRKKDAPTVVFKPTKFKVVTPLEDLKRPGVYLPLLYALLFLTLLLFLFGPLWGFFRKYVQALAAKPGAEVNIDQQMKEGGEGGGGGKGGGAESGNQQIDMNFKQKEEEEEFMKKFEPFTYITEENLKRLIYIFLLRKEEPWVIAVVLSYIKPDLARQALSMLSVEMQSKVAMESLTVKQLSREQIKAIDKDIKESVDFIMGGIEKLVRMLDDAEPAIRKNILEYIKTQKPEIYEKVKKKILMFEDIVDFPDKDMQLIVRSVSNEDVAKAVYKADPRIVNKFFSNMSKGAVTAIQEILEYSGELTLVQVDNAQLKILDAVKRLELEGKINVRQQNSQEIDIIDSADLSSGDERRRKYESMSAAGPGVSEGPSPEIIEQAGRYLAAGVDMYNQGNIQEGLQYLEYSSQVNAGEAQTWQYLGAAYYSLGRADDAMAAYEKYAALSGDPAAAEWLAGFKQQVGK